MIRISLYRDGEGGLERVILRGHAGFGEAGEDLVCAAVSGIAVGLTNASETLLGVQIHGDDVDEEEGVPGVWDPGGPDARNTGEGPFPPGSDDGCPPIGGGCIPRLYSNPRTLNPI